MRRPLWQSLPTIVGQFAVYGVALVMFVAGATQPEPDAQHPTTGSGYSSGQSGDRP